MTLPFIDSDLLYRGRFDCIHLPIVIFVIGNIPIIDIVYFPGAFYPGVPIQPVCIRYNNSLVSRTYKYSLLSYLIFLQNVNTFFRFMCTVVKIVHNY